MWYWICEGDPKMNRIAFNVIKCTRNPVYARWLASYKKWIDPSESDYWVRKDPEHSDPDYKQYGCPECGNQMSKRELDDTWDWAGPHCNNCGCTGMSMFAAVTALKPVMSGYQGIMAKFREILGNETVAKIERKERTKREGY